MHCCAWGPASQRFPAVVNASTYYARLERGDAIDNALAGRVRAGLDSWRESGRAGRALRRLANQVSEAGDAAEGRHAMRYAELASLLRRAAS